MGVVLYAPALALNAGEFILSTRFQHLVSVAGPMFLWSFGQASEEMKPSPGFEGFILSVLCRRMEQQKFISQTQRQEKRRPICDFMPFCDAAGRL